ncbi:hypothetical protein SDRG_08051 [Saprolegnia diclina VS20]|uniref:Uncharacterized protein n=1 Tax=Saprolegnia diclina (strain VS20) TaxID=1156394 RepID=T0RP88_SAPDV|nr:hypothetical protein SDRG_08051 [Saprolegnia diclina VS20]EQC34278.1 hypothetical protein SDRG_08051 [Saprolegnia diclina VS20]|eukprot:XP_008612140.1 hypothetical protein SDRG_08051 [Saprolegnia diclina VS20]
MSLLRVLGLCGVLAIALVNAAELNSTVLTNKTGNLGAEDAAFNWPDLTDKFGIQRVQRTAAWYVPVTILDSWVTIWNTIVNTRRQIDAGGKVWHLLRSNGATEFDMLRNVQDDLCLDAWWNPAANKPFVHGYKCNRDELNQRWEFYYKQRERGTQICSKRHFGWCLVIPDFGDSRMEFFDNGNTELFFHCVLNVSGQKHFNVQEFFGQQYRMPPVVGMRLPRLDMQLLQASLLDPVDALHLLHQQHAVAAHREMRHCQSLS